MTTETSIARFEESFEFSLYNAHYVRAAFSEKTRFREKVSQSKPRKGKDIKSDNINAPFYISNLIIYYNYVTSKLI